MKLAFLKNAYDPYSLAIKLWTRSKYSHVEIFFTGGLWFSASASDGGVRFCVRDYNDDEKWDFVEVPCSIEAETRMLAYARYIQETSKGYDYSGIFAFLRLGRENPSKWFCSEACGSVLQQEGFCGSENPSSYDPAEVYKLAVQDLKFSMNLC